MSVQIIETAKIKDTKEVAETRLAPYVGSDVFLVDELYVLMDGEIISDLDIEYYGKSNLFDLIESFEP